MRITTITPAGCVIRTELGSFVHLERKEIKSFLERVGLYLDSGMQEVQSETHKGVLVKQTGGIFTYIKGKEARVAETKLMLFLEVDPRVFGSTTVSMAGDCLIDLFVKKI